MKKLILFTLIVLLGWMTASAQYCASVADTPMRHEITRVSLNAAIGALNNSTACFSLTGSQGTASGQVNRYSNFTTDSLMVRPMLKKGTTYSLTVHTRNCNASSEGGIRIAYFDWNNDKDF